MRTLHIGILSAMPEEIGSAMENMKILDKKKFGDLEIYLFEKITKKVKLYISLAWSGWGKVSASRATTRLISTFIDTQPIDFLIFTGLAGTVDNSLKQGDILIANEIIQHDMDASPLFPKFVIPSIGIDKLKPNKNLLEFIFSSLEIAKVKDKLKKFGVIKKGLIATGDKFISDKDEIQKLTLSIKNLMGVEMEGASLAQVCTQESIPWAVFRVISDDADDSAPLNFSEFLENYKNYSWTLIDAIFDNIDCLEL